SQPQRGRHRDRPPDRYVGCSPGPDPRPGAEAPGRWHRCGRPVRRRGAGRRPDRPRARAGLSAARMRRREVDVPALVEQARAGSPRAVARLITLVENDHPALREVMAALAPHTGHAYIVGLTGSPGVGKSTSTNLPVSGVRGPRLAVRG